MSEYRLNIGDFAPMRPINQKFQVKGVAPTRLNDLSYGIKYGRIFLPFYHNPRVWLTYRQTYRQTEFSSLDRICIRCWVVYQFSLLTWYTGNHLPSLTGPTSMQWTVGELNSALLTIRDPDPADTVRVVTDFQPSSLPTSSLVLHASTASNWAVYNFSWTPQSRDPVVIR